MSLSKFRITIKDVFLAFLIVLIFISASYLSIRYSDNIKALISPRSQLSMLIYAFLVILAVIIAPISTLPIFPIATAAWGSFISAILNIAGWVIGAAIAFMIARRYGRPLISKFVNLEKIKKFENMVPEENTFLIVVLLRMVLPVDILSYALGLFSDMRFWPYFFATLIGITPFSFIFAYSIKLPIVYQILIVSVVFILALWGLKRTRRTKE